MSLISQAGLMVRASLFRQTGAKVELAARHYSPARFASALKALSNKETRFAAACCSREVSISEAAGWAARMGNLRLMLNPAIPRAERDDLDRQRIDQACRALATIANLVRDRGRVDNLRLLAALRGECMAVVSESGGSPLIRRAQVVPSPLFRSFTYPLTNPCTARHQDMTREAEGDWAVAPRRDRIGSVDSNDSATWPDGSDVQDDVVADSTVAVSASPALDLRRPVWV
ncbi:hypothetical protein [Xanthomonas sp. 60]